MTPNLPQRNWLNNAGLNRQHVFDLASLPADLTAPLQPQPHERQLLLFAHAGRRLWERVQANGTHTAHPIDDHSVHTVTTWLAQALPKARTRFVFPGEHPIGLQRLGALAGWHHASPFMVGIDAVWGTWFAYRAAILADTALPPSEPVRTGHPCHTCTDKPCISACAAGALAGGQFNFPACNAGRLAEVSPCALGCTARNACPVGAEHRYEDSQIRHGALGSLAYIRQHFGPR
jgi:hypothetical protein